MAFTRIHHVGMVTGDMEAARHLFCDGFGLSVDEHRTPWPQGRSRRGEAGTSIEFPIGEMYYEVSAPTDSESSAAQFLNSTSGRGGIHYISIASDNIGADVQTLLDRGVKLKGDWDGESATFLDPTTCQGLELQITTDDRYYVHPTSSAKVWSREWPTWAWRPAAPRRSGASGVR